jgi:DNA polymerase delta subunit 2
MTTSQNGGVEHRPVRSFASHTPKWQRFQNKITAQTSTSSGANNNQSSSSVKSSEREIVPYQRQYSHVYSYRLAALKDGCWKRLNQPTTTKGCRNVNRILELQEDKLSNVVGTIILESMNGNSDDNYYNEDDADGEDRQLHPDVKCRSGDQLFLEDESGRVALRFVDDADADDSGKYKLSSTSFAYQYCTGVVVGVHGSVDAKGVMHARRIVTPALAPPIVAPNTGTDDNDDGESTSTPHLLLVSSLLCGDPEVSSLPREMLVSYLQGHFNDGASKVARVIVAGSGPGAIDPAMGLREFDLWGLEVTRVAGIPLDILPSATDPTTRNWPQRPLHSSLLPHTLRATGSTKNTGSDNSTPMARTTPNPYEALIGNQLVLGTDGLNVRDLQKYILKPPPGSSASTSALSKKDGGDSNNDSDGTKSLSPQPLTELDALEQTLQWAHICPTGPNSPAIGMVPSGDPMVMDRRASNIYFCGNCEEGFATKLLAHNDDGDTAMGGTAEGAPKTRLICVPKFSETGEAVLVNLKTLAVEILRFTANGDKKSD